MTKSKISTESLIGDMVATLNEKALKIISEEIHKCMGDNGYCTTCSLKEKCYAYWDKKITNGLIVESHLMDILRKIRAFRYAREEKNNANLK